ncbi:unnamed protein product [Protopolystoma xenopodis]|uniref:Uncharacterized protein n=1 Tax=Protopolystoma xenopodis TaxID=117903 RepID=A0A448XKV0_9PLAT|nr:unnamed protein product [Protopolystoma xenopodis]
MARRDDDAYYNSGETSRNNTGPSFRERHSCFIIILQARQKLGIPWAGGSDCPAERASHILDQNYLDTRLVRRERLRQMQSIWLEEEFLAIVDELRLVWADNAIRQAFDQRSKMITEDFVSFPSI